MAEFGMSDATMSRDMSQFLLLLPDCSPLKIAGGKITVLDPGALHLPPQLPGIPMASWLQVMLGSRHVALAAPERAQPSDATIRGVVRAVQDRRSLAILYVSRRSDDACWRVVSPHSVVDVAGRMHMRGWDHDKGRFGDFVLARILRATFDRGLLPGYVDHAEDADWHTITLLSVTAVSGSPSEAVRVEYALGEDGKRVFRTRKALAHYVTDDRQPGFDTLVTVSLIGADSRFRQARRADGL
ncbi:WYL domain-containing protein [Frigidibacter sp. MR17.24]|uniref:WYL domain-containing protein n=1 Tax=Frigidibacter sp. MR17.24 TaxID=3127345 RepID=UPI003012F339